MDKAGSTSAHRRVEKRDLDEHLHSDIANGDGTEPKSDEEEDMTLQLGASPSKKRKKRHHCPNQGRIKRGALSEFRLLGTPFDIFSHITSFLDPCDLLHLARSSRGFHAVLMSESVEQIWIDSRKNVPNVGGIEFPQRPPDLSEPAYASLAFDRKCLVCGRKANRFDARYRMRLCDACSDGQVGLSPAWGDLHSFRSLLESQGAQPLGGESGDAELKTIRTLVLQSIINWNPLRSGDPQIFGPHALQIYKQCMVYKARMDPEEYTQYLYMRQQDMQGIRQHAQKLFQWHNESKRGRGTESYIRVQNLTEKRRLEITRRLINGGFLAEDFPQDPRALRGEARSNNEETRSHTKAKFAVWRALVLNPSRLLEAGENGWDAIKPKLETIVSSNRKIRLKKEQEALLHKVQA